MSSISTKTRHTNKSLITSNCQPNSTGFTQNISSRSLLLVETASPSNSVSDNGSISSESSTTNSNNNNNNNSSSIGRKSNLLWLNTSGNNSVNDTTNDSGHVFSNSTRNPVTYMNQTSTASANTAFSINHSSPLPQRPNSQHSLTPTSHASDNYSRYHGANQSGGILWPLPPINQGQVNCTGGNDAQTPNLPQQHNPQSTHGALLKSQMQSSINSENHIASSKSNKKESHNRIERKRRDYINTQISSLGSLLPQELYRGVDGKRNKGSVLKLSVNYIQDLRNQLARMNSVQEENHLARQLIPIILQRVKFLEKTMTKLVNECFNSNDLDGNQQIKSDSIESMEKKLFKLQKLLYDAISNKFDYMSTGGTSGPSSNVVQAGNKHWDNFDGIENENRSVLDNEVIQAWLSVFENNKSQEVYERKVDYVNEDSGNNNDIHHDNNNMTGMGKHRFPNDPRNPLTSAKNSRRHTRNSANNSLISNCSSEASNSDESSPLSNIAANSCQVDHQLFYANQPSSSANGNSIDNGQSLLLSYSNPNHSQNSNTTDFNLNHLQPEDLLMTNSNPSGNNHCPGMRGNKISEEMLCHDNPIILSSFFTSQSYEHPMSANSNGANTGQNRLSSDHLHQQHPDPAGASQYHMILQDHRSTNSDHSRHTDQTGGGSISESIYQTLHIQPQSTITNQQN